MDNKTLRCRGCGQMFEHDNRLPSHCPACQIMREEQYQIVRAIVKEFPGITALEVHDFTEIPIETILRYINKGMIEVLSKARDGEIEERIGVMIRKIKENRVLLKKPEKPKKSDSPFEPNILHEDESKEKFTWHSAEESENDD